MCLHVYCASLVDNDYKIRGQFGDNDYKICRPLDDNDYIICRPLGDNGIMLMFCVVAPCVCTVYHIIIQLFVAMLPWLVAVAVM